jgi:CRISPR-associated endoribonuclease Cas6
MLYSCVYKLRIKENNVLPLFSGYLVYSAYLHMISKINIDLANEMHEENINKKYTVSQVLGDFHKLNNFLVLDKDNDYHVRVTFLDSELFSKIMAMHMDGKIKNIKVGKCDFDIVSLFTTPEQHSKVRFAQKNKLIEDARKGGKEVCLKFMSPTFFKVTKNRYDYLPNSKKIFSSLKKKTESVYENLFFDDKFLDLIYIKKFKNINTKSIEFGKARIVGFVGTVCFGINSADNSVLQLFNLLGDMAIYTGVGAKSSIGFGQTMRIYED